MKSPSINISKIDAAKRQLETAIVLYFSNADLVSIHTLSAASHEIIQTLCKPNNVKSAIKDFDSVKPEKKKEYIDLVQGAQRFFKHANIDADKLYEFIPDTTDFLIFDACQMYQQLTNEIPKLFQIFTIWFFLKEPDIIRDDKQEVKDFTAKNKNSFDLNNRTNFFQRVSEGYDLLFTKCVNF